MPSSYALFPYHIDSPVYCFNESERVTPTYSNAPTIEIPLETVKFDGCTWGSGQATNMLGYILTREKMGVPVELGIDYTDYTGYYFTDWLESGTVDIFMEMWNSISSSDTTVSDMIEDNVASMAYTGVIGKQGLWIPKWMTEVYPFADHYIGINDSSIREYIRNETIEFLQNNAEFGDLYLDVALNNSNPIVWFSVEYYVGNQYFNNVIDYYNLGYTPFHTGSQEAMAVLCTALYQAGVPFLFMDYTPVWEMYLIDWAPVSFPSNPTESFNDVCMVNNTCAFPPDYLYVLYNSQLQESHPELLSMIRKMKFDSYAIADMTYTARLRSAANVSENAIQTYFYSACDWLQENRDTWEPWVVEYERDLETVNNSISLFHAILGGVLGLVAFVGLIIVVREIINFCRRIQSALVDDGMSASAQRKRRMITSAMKDTVTTGSTIFDFLTDAILGVKLLFFKYSIYPSYFITIYTAFTIIAMVVTVVDLLILIYNLREVVITSKVGVRLETIESDFDWTDEMKTSQELKLELQNKIASKAADQKTEITLAPEKLDNRRATLVHRLSGFTVAMGYKASVEELDFLDLVSRLNDSLHDWIHNKRELRSASSACFVALLEEIPFLFLNIWALLVLKQWDALMFVSIISSAIAVGFKLHSVPEFMALIALRTVIASELVSIRDDLVTTNVEFSEQLLVEGPNEEDDDDKEKRPIASNKVFAKATVIDLTSPIIPP